MYCKNCGSEMKEGALFCPKCGTKVTKAPAKNNSNSKHKAGRSFSQNTNNIDREYEEFYRNDNKKPSKNTRTIIIGSVAAIAVMGLIMFFLARSLFGGNDSKKESVSSNETAEQGFSSDNSVSDTSNADDNPQDITAQNPSTDNVTPEDYINNTLLKDYSYVNVNNESYDLKFADSNYNLTAKCEVGSGIIGTVTGDFDNDSEDEIAVLYLNGSAISQNSISAAGNVNSVEMWMYEKTSNSYECADKYTIIDYLLGSTPVEGSNIFISSRNSDLYICSQYRGEQYLWADGITCAMKMVTYKNNKFEEQINESVGGSSFDSICVSYSTLDLLSNLGFSSTVNKINSDYVCEFAQSDIKSIIFKETVAISNAKNASNIISQAMQNNNDSNIPPLYGNIDMKNTNYTLSELLSSSDDGWYAGEIFNSVSSEVFQNQSNEDYIIPDSNTRYITKSDVENLSAYELKLARNEIFARHGRIFESEDLNAYFNSKDWYTGTVTADNFKETMLNDYEIKNIEVIKAEEN